MALATQFKATADDVATFVPAAARDPVGRTDGRREDPQTGRHLEGARRFRGKYLKDGKLVVEVEKELELGLRIIGSATFDPSFEGKVGVGLLSTSEFRMAFDTESAFRFDMALGKKVEQRVPLGKLMLTCINFVIGGVPVTVCPVGAVDLVLEADGRAGLAFEVSYKRRLGLALKSVGPNVDVNGINEPIDDPFSFKRAETLGNVAASAGMAAKFVVAFYGQGGPEIELTPYLEYEIDTASDPAAKLVFGIQLGGGLKFDFLQRKLVRWVKPDVLKFEEILWESGGPYIGVVIDPGSTELAIGGSQQFTARMVGVPDDPATWRVVKGPGTIDSTGLYKATADGLAEIEALIPAGVGHGELKNTATVKVSGFLPSEPRNVRATAGIRTAEVTWDAPEFSGQNPITHYFVSTSPGTGAVKVPVTAGTRVTLRNLTPNTDYTVTVTAVNADGVGLPGSSGTITPRTTTLSDPGGSDITDGVDGEESGIDGVVFSDSGRYAFFATKKVDRQFYLIRRDLADRSDEVVSVKADGTTPEPIASGFPWVSSESTAPNYATSGEGRYIAYRTAAGSVNQNDQIAVRDLETGQHWTTPVTPNKVSVFRLSADGTKVTYITGSGGSATRRVYQAIKGQSDAAWLDGCFDPKSCGSGSPSSSA